MSFPAKDAPALLQPDQMEGMFAGLDKMGEALPMEKKQQMEQLLATSTDPEDEKAGWANVAFLSDRYGKDPQEIAQNADAYRENYAQQMGWDEASGADDKAFYGRVGQHFKTMKDERGLLTEGLGRLFEHFQKGEDDWRQSFRQSLTEMAGKPGYDAKRLDLYRHLAESQWNQWQESGQHYPAVIEALDKYYKFVRKGAAPGQEDEARATRQAALAALKTVPEHDQEAVLGLAARGAPAAPEMEFVQKAANRVEQGVGETARKGLTGLADLTRLLVPGVLGHAPLFADQAGRKTERKLDQAVSGAIDPNQSQQWLAKGVLGAAEGLPSMLAMFTPPGIAINLGAYSEEARGHFEDAGVAPEKAAVLGPLAGLGLTALQTVNSQVLMGKAASAGVEKWLAANAAGGVKGYAKNVLALGAIDTAVLGPITAGQQLTEPAIQSVAAQLDKTIPQIKWTGKDGELAALARATPETLAGLVPLIVLGTGVGTLRHSAYARNNLKNETALKAVGLPDESVKMILGEPTTERAEFLLQQEWEKRVANVTAVHEMNEASAKFENEGGRVTLADDGAYIVKDETGNPVDQTASAEMAAKAIKDEGKAPDLSGRNLGTTKEPPMHYGVTNPAMAKAMNFVADLGHGMARLWRELRGLPEFGKFREIINEFNAETQRRAMTLAGEVKQVFEAVPDKLTRRAMYRAIEAGFDKQKLAEWAGGSSRKSSKDAYEAALKLTPDQIAYAKQVKAWFEAKHPQAVAAGLLDPNQKRPNYVPLMVDKLYEVKGLPSQYGGKLKGDFSHAITREFEHSFAVENATDEQGDNLGLKLKTDDLPEVMAAYGAELDKVDLTRQALGALESQKAKAEDGEPLVQPVHGVITKDSPEKGTKITNPSSAVSESGVKYETLDHPAFKRWYFAGKDAEGKPVMFKGEMGLHPDIYNHVANILERSKLQNWADSPGGAVAHLAKTAFKSVQTAQRFVKANMFSASAFHATHIGTRAAGNLVARWDISRVYHNDPKAIDAMKHGLQLFSDNAAMQEVAEGLGGGKGYNVLAKVPGIGKVVDGITKATFHDIIPAYKLETWKHLNAKNQALFAKDIAAGRATAAQVKYLTSQQVNARFGEQNYVDLGANPTFRHVLSLLTLAPDFWRSNLQNFKQVGTGLTGAKAGREPAKAFVITAGVTWLAARVLNKALSDDDSYHFDDPFAVHHGNKTYTFRTEVQDVEKMITNPNQYLMGRLSPFASSALEYLSGVNWRGEKVGAVDVLKETATKAIPASLKWLPGPAQAAEWGEGHRATTSHGEQFLTSQGIKVGRDSPLNAAYKLASAYKKEVLNVEDKGGAYPVSKFQQLRYALEDGDLEKAKEELATLEEKTPPAKLSHAFHASIFHAWTGSHKTDHAFKESLGPGDRAKVEQAEAHRLDIWAAFRKLRSGDTGHEPDESP